MKKRIFFVCIIILFVFVSCSSNEDDRERHVMKDGTVFYTDSDIEFYGDKAAFRDAVLENKEHDDDVKDELVWVKDSLYGYNGEIKTVEWEKVKFGSWISDYGLSPDFIYFVSLLEVSKYIPATYEDWVIKGEYFMHDKDSIGTDVLTGNVGFCMGTSISRGYYNAKTMIKCISYDENGKSIGVYFPIRPENLKWKFFRTKTIW